jgi:hypothetical protein
VHGRDRHDPLETLGRGHAQPPHPGHRGPERRRYRVFQVGNVHAPRKP